MTTPTETRPPSGDSHEPPAGAGKTSAGTLLLDTVRNNMRQYGMLVALALIVVLFQIWTDGSLLLPNNVSNIVQQNSYILILAMGMMIVIIAGSHRSVGRLPRRVRRSGRRGDDGQARHAMAAGAGALAADRRRGRGLAGLLDRLRRHPVLHRDAGRDAALPRRYPDPAGGPVDRALPEGLPGDRAGIHPRDGPLHAVPQPHAAHRARRHRVRAVPGMAGQAAPVGVRAGGAAVQSVAAQVRGDRRRRGGLHPDAGQLPRCAGRAAHHVRAADRAGLRDAERRRRAACVRAGRQQGGGASSPA